MAHLQQLVFKLILFTQGWDFVGILRGNSSVSGQREVSWFLWAFPFSKGMRATKLRKTSPSTGALAELFTGLFHISDQGAEGPSPTRGVKAALFLMKSWNHRAVWAGKAL